VLGVDKLTETSAVASDDSLRVERNALTLREKATEILRQAIVDRRFAPGTHLKERELCELLGVSRTSVREALRHLESERLIKNVPHKGPVVASPNLDEAREIYQVRASLEGLAGELFAQNASDSHMRDLEQTAKRMSSAAAENDPAKTLAIINKFYEVLFDGARNQVCAQFIETLNARISMFRHMTLSTRSRDETMMREIFEIVEAAKLRDSQRLKNACIAHVEGAYEALLTQLDASAKSNVTD